jgi:DNA-binding response OmpR family regulator
MSDHAEFSQALGDSMPGTVCIAFDDVNHALFTMQEENVIPNFIFVELHMRGTSGIDFLKKLKQTNRLKDIPVIVHATLVDDDRIIELKELGALAIYMKPYDYFGLRAFLNLYFTNRILISSQN